MEMKNEMLHNGCKDNYVKALIIIKSSIVDHNLTTRFKFTKEIPHH